MEVKACFTINRDCLRLYGFPAAEFCIDSGRGVKVIDPVDSVIGSGRLDGRRR